MPAPVGPVTANGKAKVALNALRHGLCGRSVVIPGESDERFKLILQGLLADYNPQSTTEYLLIEEMATAAWRERRAMAYEAGYLADSIQAEGLAGRQAWRKSDDARLAHRYETTSRRAFQSSLRNLLTVSAILDGPGLAHEDPEPEAAPDENTVLRNKPENSNETKDDATA